MKKIIIISILISIIIYFIGLSSGIFITSLFEKRLEETNRKLSSLESDIAYLLILTSSQSCDLLKSFFNGVFEDLNSIRNIVLELEKQNRNDEIYNSVIDKFFTTSIKTWILAKTIDEKCGIEKVPVLYFYSVNCEKCFLQGEILEELQKEGKIISFHVNINQKNSLIEANKKIYNISSVPSLIIKDVKYGFLNKTEISKILER